MAGLDNPLGGKSAQGVGAAELSDAVPQIVETVGAAAEAADLSVADLIQAVSELLSSS